MTTASPFSVAAPAPAAARARSGPPSPGQPILLQVPLPASEPPFDDELASPAIRGPGVGGRVVYLASASRKPAASTAGSPALRSPAPPHSPAPYSAALHSAALHSAAAPHSTAGQEGTAPALAAGPQRPDIIGDRNPRPVDAVAAPDTTPPARLRLVGAPASRAGRRSPARPVAAGGVALRALHPYEPAGTPGSPDHEAAAAGFGPGPRLCVDSATHRSRLLGSVDDGESSRSTPLPAQQMPDPRPLALQVIQAVVEVLAGDRQVTQLTAWVDEEVYAAVAAAAPDLAKAPATPLRRPPVARIRLEDRPIVRSVHVTEPAAGVAEVSARVQTGVRSRAIALRLEQWRGRWRCNALTVG